MRYEDAVRWLDEHGGLWSVRATRWACEVTASLGPVRTVIHNVQLTADRVEEALVNAVAQIQWLSGEAPTAKS